MAQQPPFEAIAAKRVVYEIDGMDRVPVHRDIEYLTSSAGTETIDVYYPVDATPGERVPAVIFISGYSDIGMQKMLGRKFKEMGAYVSWSQLVAASGMAAVTYTTTDPAAQVHNVLEHINAHAEALNLDNQRTAIWACSGNVPNALAVLMSEAGSRLKCAVLCYGYMLDLNGSTGVADAVRMAGFVNPNAGKTMADLPPTLPLFITRAGRDQMPRLNETIDSFIAGALALNLPLTIENYPDAPHSFDLFFDTVKSREIVKHILGYLRFHLV